MPKIHVTTDEGELVEAFSNADLDETITSTPAGRAALLESVLDAIERAQRIEARNAAPRR